jgi:hypothetical protein
MRPVAPSRLAVAPDPVSRQREEQGAQSERLEIGRVEEESGVEADERSEHGAAKQSDRGERHQDEIGRAASGLDGRHDRRLEDHRDEEDAGGLEDVGSHAP